MMNNSETKAFRNDNAHRAKLVVRFCAPKTAKNSPVKVADQGARKQKYALSLIRMIRHLTMDLSIPSQTTRQGRVSHRVDQTRARDVAQLWAAAYFLPMLDYSKDASSDPEDTPPIDDLNDHELSPIRIVQRPKRGFKLPSVFCSCKKFDRGW
jgi:hypothetical protein